MRNNQPKFETLSIDNRNKDYLPKINTKQTKLVYRLNRRDRLQSQRSIDSPGKLRELAELSRSSVGHYEKAGG